jgi:hypothetical protein
MVGNGPLPDPLGLFESEICDCDPEYRRIKTLQQESGMRIGEAFRQNGTEEAVIVCKNCGREFPAKRNQFGLDLLSNSGPF